MRQRILRKQNNLQNINSKKGQKMTLPPFWVINTEIWNKKYLFNLACFIKKIYLPVFDTLIL